MNHWPLAPLANDLVFRVFLKLRTSGFLPPRRQDNHPPPRDLPAALRTKAVLLDQEMLQTPDMRILRGEFHRLPEGHHTVDGLFCFKKRPISLRGVVFEVEGLLKERLHLAHRVAAQNGNLQALFFEILERAGLPFLLCFESQNDIRFFWIACNRCGHLEIIDCACEPILADPIRIDSDALTRGTIGGAAFFSRGSRGMQRMSLPRCWRFLFAHVEASFFPHAHLGPNTAASQKSVHDGSRFVKDGELVTSPDLDKRVEGWRRFPLEHGLLRPPAARFFVAQRHGMNA